MSQSIKYMQNDILYSLCWEDPNILLQALKISRKDNVLSIASGGENIFAILLKNPAKVVAIDNNSYQIYLVKLKIAAIKALGFQEFIQFLGFNSSISIIQSFEKCKRYLSKEELNYWENNTKIINNGIVHCGKFEKYLYQFRKYVLPLVLSKKEIKKYHNNFSVLFGRFGPCGVDSAFDDLAGSRQGLAFEHGGERRQGNGG